MPHLGDRLRRHPACRPDVRAARLLDGSALTTVRIPRRAASAGEGRDAPPDRPRPTRCTPSARGGRSPRSRHGCLSGTGLGLVWESMTGFRLILTAPRSVAESAWARSTTMPSSCIRPTTCSPAGVNPILGAWRTLSPSSLFRFQLQEERRLDSAREAPIAADYWRNRRRSIPVFIRPPFGDERLY